MRYKQNLWKWKLVVLSCAYTMELKNSVFFNQVKFQYLTVLGGVIESEIFLL